MAHHQYKPKKFRRTPSWLWWTALVVGTAGGAAIYYLYPDAKTSEEHTVVMLIALFTLLTTGICVIAATSDFWMRH